jgi:hypothetical protein
MKRRSIEFISICGRMKSAAHPRRCSATLWATIVLSLAMNHIAPGSTITYNGPFPGATVVYGPVISASDQGVRESSQTDAVPLFGPPSVTGDSIDFNPTGFGAFGAGGGGDVTDGQLVFKVQAKPNFAINSINFGEAGITTLAGVGTNVTHTDVSAVGNIDIYEVDGVLINKISVPLNLVFTPLTATGNQGTFQLVADAGLGLSSLPWSGSQSLNLNQVLTNKGITFSRGATLIGVDLDNTLIAQSEIGTVALIDKKDFGGVSITINGPEPTALVLAGLGFLGLFGARHFAK